MASANSVELRAPIRISAFALIFRLGAAIVAFLAAAAVHAQDGYVFSTIAGKAGVTEKTDGAGADARFNRPRGLAIDAAGAIYVADSWNGGIRKVVMGGDVTVSTLPITEQPTSDGLPAGLPATLPSQLGLAPDGSVIFLDDLWGSVRKLKGGTLSTVRAFMRSEITPNGIIFVPLPDGGFAQSLTLSPGGTINVGGSFAASHNYVPKIQRLKPDGSVGSTWLGVTGVPLAMAADGPEDLVLVDGTTSSIVRLVSSGDRVPLAGGVSGASDGLGTAASFQITRIGSGDGYFSGPEGIALDVNHNAYVADTLNNTIRRVTSDGHVTTIGGLAGQSGSQDGSGQVARFNAPSGIVVDGAGVLYIADSANHTIRKGVPAYLPKFTAQPQSGSVKVGETVTLSATVATNTLATKYQWQKDGVPITGATAATLEIRSAQSSDAGSYTVVLSNDLGSLASSVANVTVDVPAVSRIVNVSIRTGITTTAPMVTVGFVVGGGSKPLLVRTVGPKLKEYGVGDAIADPKLALFKGDAQIAANDNWSAAANAADVATAAQQVGAFALANGAADAALLTTLNGSAYTVQATGAGNATGTALVEVYDVDPASGGHLVNVSSRAQVGTGDNVLMAGFAVTGTAKKTLLIRAVGPTLATFGVAGALSDPKIELIPSGATTAIATNDNWAGDPALAAAFTSVGAFAFTNAQSKDAALVVTVPPGSYSAKVSGVNGATGEALVEIYELP